MGAASAQRGGRRRSQLLVVDDNPGYLRLVRLALEDDGVFEVAAEARSAEDAAAAATAVRPDVALVDLLLPGADGVNLPSMLRHLVPACVVVLTSAHAEGDSDAIGELGGLAVLPKSVAPSRLGHELTAVLADRAKAQDVVRQAVTRLPPSPTSPATARRFVGGMLEEWGYKDLLDTVRLLVSELVGNAVLHTTSPIELSMRLVAGRLRVDVVDQSTHLPKRRDAGEEDQTGRGSDLVERLTSAWGVSGRPDGKSVWFEIALPREPSAAKLNRGAP